MGQFNPEAYAQGRRSTLYPNAPAGLLFAGDSGVPVDGIRPVYTNFMPRVGVAYDVFGTGRTSIRGGGGMFYDTRSNGLFNNAWIGSAPFVTSVNLSPANTRFSNPYGATINPFPTPFPTPASAPFIGTPSVITFDPSGTFKVPLTYAWNLALEQQMTERLSTRIAYVGGHGSRIFTSPDINPAIYGPGATTANTNSRRRYPGYGFDRHDGHGWKLLVPISAGNAARKGHTRPQLLVELHMVKISGQRTEWGSGDSRRRGPIVLYPRHNDQL